METNEFLTKIKLENLTNLCRICLEDKKLIFPILSTQIGKIEAKILFEFCLSLEIDEQVDDPTPKCLCENCLKQLHDFYWFKKRSYDSEIAFQHFISVKENPENLDEQSFRGNTVMLNTSVDLGNEALLVKTEPLDYYDDQKNCQELIQNQNKLTENIQIKTGQFEVKPFNQEDNTQAMLSPSHTESKRNQNLNNDEKVFKCNNCPKLYSTKKSLRKHWTRYPDHNPNREIDEQKLILRNLLKTPNEKRSRDKIECPTCNQQFQTVEEKKAHQLKTRHKLTPIECVICKKMYPSRPDLKRHLRTHTLEKPFQCKLCLKCFSLGSTLQEHQKVHTGEKPFVCGICSMTFAYKSNFSLHVKSKRCLQYKRNRGINTNREENE